MSRDPQIHDHMKRKRYDTKWHQSVFDKPRWDAGELDFEKYIDEYVRKNGINRKGIQKIIPNIFLNKRLLKGVEFAAPGFVKFIQVCDHYKQDLETSEFAKYLKEKWNRYYNYMREPSNFERLDELEQIEDQTRSKTTDWECKCSNSRGGDKIASPMESEV